MKLKLSAKTKKAICIYVIVLLLLYIVVQVLPKVTDIFETTDVLKVGSLALSCETTGYLVKDEYVCIAGESGDITFTEEANTVVKKGHKMCSVDPKAQTAGKDTGDDGSRNRYSKYTDRLGDTDRITDSYKAPISGVFSFVIDGYEGTFTRDNMNELKREQVEACEYDSVDLDRSAIYKGEPVYKISGDDEWFVLCWIESGKAGDYPEGEKVTLELPAGNVSARVCYTANEGEYTRVIFELDVYYAEFASSRALDMTVVARADEGLIVRNESIVEKNGVQGVYVVDKNDREHFTQVKIISTDGTYSVLKDTTFYDDEGNQVMTVDVYDTVLRHPENALEKDLKNQEGDD